MISFAALAVFSGLSLNLLLQFALGTAGAAGDLPPKGKREIPFGQLCILFLSLVILWAALSYALPPNWKGFLEYFLFFPLSALVCGGLEFFLERAISRLKKKPVGLRKVFSANTAYEGLVPVALFITLAAAPDFAGAAVLALFFSAGNLAAMLILNEIRRRSTLEWVPQFLRGSPLILISMGLLALIFGTAAGLCFKILEVF